VLEKLDSMQECQDRFEKQHLRVLQWGRRMSSLQRIANTFRRRIFFWVWPIQMISIIYSKIIVQLLQ
jgi:hypothetical protein